MIRTGKGNFVIFDENRFSESCRSEGERLDASGFSRFRVLERAVGGEVRGAAHREKYNKKLSLKPHNLGIQ